MPKPGFNIWRFTVIGLILCVGLFAACETPTGDDSKPAPKKPTENTFVKFDNLEQYPVTIYSDAGRNIAIAEISALGSAVVAVEPVSAGNAFYLTFQLDIFDIPGVSIPCNGGSIVHLIKANETTSVPIPKLKSIEINSAYLKIINNSSYSLALRQGSGEKGPIGGGSTVINTGQNAAYDVLPGLASNYSIYSNTTIPVAFPASLTEFRPGIIYVFTFNGTSLALTDNVSLLQTFPPAVPENVRAEALSKDSARIAWNDAYGAISYRIFRAEGSLDASYSQVGNSATRSWTDTGLTAGEIYYYKVSASSGGNRESGQSAAVFAVMPTSDIWVPAVTDSSVSLAWSVVNGADGYNIYRSDSENGPYIKINPNPIAIHTFTDTGLDTYRTYYYKISAVSNGMESERSDAFEITLLPAPGNVRVTSVTDDSITLAWNTVNGAVGYNIYRSFGENGTYSKLNSGTVTDTAFTDTGLDGFTTYYYKICAISGNIECVRSNAVSGTTLLSVPGNVQITSVTDTSISLAWNLVNNANSYNIYRSDSENGTYNKVNSGTVISATFTDTGLNANTAYYYKISAVSGSSESGQSDVVSGVTLMPIPGNVRIISVTDTSVTLEWNAVSEANGYNVYRSNSANGAYTKINTIVVSGATFTNTGVSPYTSYWYKVSAITVGVESALSSPALGTTLLSAPGNVQVTSVTDASVSLAWNTLSGASGYNVYRSDSENGVYTKINNSSVNGTTFTDTGINPYIAVYYYKVSAVAGGIEGVQSNSVASPSVTVTASGLAAKLAWLQSNVQSNNLYIIEVDTDESITPQTLSYSGKSNVGIILIGKGTMRTVNLSTTTGRLFNVGSNVTLTLDNNITLKGRTNNDSSLVSVNNGGALIMNIGAKITGNTSSSSNGGGVSVNNNSTFTMNGGEISGNTAASSYGGGGGVAVATDGTFIMSGGKISGNSSNRGGGVHVYGTFTMSGGEISGNTTGSGGGVDVAVYGTFTMNGGKISGNTTTSYGGGVNLTSTATFTKTGNSIITGWGDDTVNGNVVKSSGTVQNNRGHAVFSGSSARKREKTVYAGENLDSAKDGAAGGWVDP